MHAMLHSHKLNSSDDPNSFLVEGAMRIGQSGEVTFYSHIINDIFFEFLALFPDTCAINLNA